MASIWHQLLVYLRGPHLYSVEGFKAGYMPNPLESLGSTVVGVSEALKTFCVAFSPLLLPYLLMRYDPSTLLGMTKCALIVYGVALFLRAAGRFANADYRRFAALQFEVLASGPSKISAELRKRLKRYDYEIARLPTAVDFEARARPSKWFAPTADEDGREAVGEPWATLREAAAYWAAHSFGCRILFPGSVALLKAMMGDTLADNRRKAINSKIAERNVVRTEDGTIVDTMFWDRRGQSQNGNTLVVCFEGNAGFCEVGVTGTPNALGYSVLGWNKPGFGESGGRPTPRAIVYAADAVMQLATERLGFPPERIVLYAWSIGGYAATWAAANYPDVRALILDASFDDLVPLAVGRMPSVVAPLVRYSVRQYLNLPIARQLRKYPGPVRFIRRWHEDIIINDAPHLDEHGRRATNRANDLLVDFLRHRYPGLFRTERDVELVRTWLALDSQSRLMMFNSDEPSQAHAKMLSALKTTEHIDDKKSGGLELLSSAQLSTLIQQLCHKHFIDFEASHNTPLNAIFFNIPTHLPGVKAGDNGGRFPGQGYVLGRANEPATSEKTAASEKTTNNEKTTASEDQTQSPTPPRRNSRESICTLYSTDSSADSEKNY